MVFFSKLTGFVRRSFQVRSQDNKEFWFGQFIIILSTVLGVYLAAFKGFEIAVTFDRLAHQRDSYYLQQSFYQELEDNTQTIQSKILDVYDDKSRITMLRHTQDQMVLDNFVWNAMQESEITFQIDPKILKASRNFYRDYNLLFANVDSPHPYDQKVTIDKIREMNENIKTNILPLLSEDIGVLKEKVRKAGMIDN